MESGKELKLSEKKNKKANKQKMESTIESVQQVASDELDKAKARFVGGRSIDRGNPEDEDENIQSDDEGMIEEIVTTVEEDKDLECKVKKKIETKKTIAQDPETHNKITKVVKTEVTEITRTITINDQHDLERAKRELGIDDVNKLLPSTQIIYNVPSTYHSTSSWMDHPRLTHVQEKYYEPSNEIVTSGDFPSDSPIKQHSPTIETAEKDIKQDQPLAEATTVGRGPVVETISSSSSVPVTTTAAEQKPVDTPKKKKKSSLGLCSCTRSTTTDYDEEQRKHKAATIVEQKSKQKKKASVTTTNALLSATNLPNETTATGQSPNDTLIQGQPLISDDIKQLIAEKKSLVIDYFHSKIFFPSKLFTSNEQDVKARKVSSRICDLLHHDRCSSWTNLYDQVKDEYADQLPPNMFIQPMIKTYEHIFINKQSNILNTFATIHNEKDIKNLPENHDYISVVQTYLNERDNQPNIAVITKPFVENIEDTLERLQHHVQSDEKVIDSEHEKQKPPIHTKETDMSDDLTKNASVYDEEQLTKALAEISLDKPITLAEAIAYQHIDLDNPKLGLSNDTIERIKHLFRPLSKDDESKLNIIRISRGGQFLTDFDVAKSNTFETFHLSEPFIYQLQQSFEPTLDFNEKQFRSLTDAILKNKEEYSKLQFDIGRTLIPADDLKESSTNDFSQSDSGYSVTTATYESLASKVKNEFETINEPISDQLNESDKTKPASEYEISDSTDLQSRSIDDKPIVHLQPRPATIEPVDVQADVLEEKPVVHLEPRAPIIEPVDVQSATPEEKSVVHLQSRAPAIEPVDVAEDELTVHLQPRSPTIEPVDVQSETVEHKSITHLEPRAPTIEPVDVQPEQTPIVIPSTKSHEPSSLKTTTATTSLHGAAVNLPDIELVEPGPLPTLAINKEKHKKVKGPITTTATTEKPVKTKKSNVGLCASCFGSKAAEKKKKEVTSETSKAPIEQKKLVEEEKKDDVPSATILTTSIDSPAQELPSSTNDTIVLPHVDIDTFQERTFETSSEHIPRPEDRLDATIEKLVTTEEPHYQLPSSEPVPPAVPIENEYSVPAHDTYDIPRSIETPSVENIQINTEEKIFNNELKSSNDLVLSSSPKIESTVVTKTDTMPNVEVKESSTKGSYTLPTKKSKTKKEKEPKVKTEKKPGLFSNMFRHSDRKSKAPALNLPPVERDLSTDNELRRPHRQESDPLRVPNTSLPDPDLSLPTYDQPEVNTTSGHTKSSSEFSIPITDLPPIPNLELPENDKQLIDSNVDLMKIPSVQLPELKFTSTEQKYETIANHDEKIPEVPLLTEIKQEKEVEHLPTVEAGLALASPVQDMLDIQTDQKNFPIETDYAAKIDSIIPDLPKLPSEERDLLIKPELLSTEQKYTITDTHFVPPPELPITIDKQTTAHYEAPPKLPDFAFELPAAEPVKILSKDISSSPPSFDDDVPTVTSKIVPAVEISTPPIKSETKEVIQSKADVKKKSSTLALCSCFGNKSHASKAQTLPVQKEKSKSIKAPKADLPAVDMPLPSSNISSVFETKGSLHAPSNDLPAVELPSPSIEHVRLSALHTHEKKRQAPKKPIVQEAKVLAQTTSPEAVVPIITTVNEIDVQPTIETKTTEESLAQLPITEQTVVEELLTRSTTHLPPTMIEKQSEEPILERPPTPTPLIKAQPYEEILVASTTSTSTTEKQPVEERKTESSIEKQATEAIKESHPDVKKHSSFEIKAPAFQIPELDLSGPPKSDSYVSSLKHGESTTTQSRSDSGLEAIISSHLHPSSTFGTNQTIEDVNQHPSISSGLGSDILASTTTTTKASTTTDLALEKRSTIPKRENSLLRHDFARKISINEESRAKLIFRQNDLKACLESEISKSIDDFDAKRDHKSLNKILTHAIDLIKDKKVSTYPELKQKLIIEHKNEAFIVDPVVNSLYCTIEKQGLDNLDKPEFPIAIRDMVRLPAKQAFDTVQQLNKDITEQPPRISHEKSSATHSCLTCGRSKSAKPKMSTTIASSTTTGLLDERRRLQLNTHRNELGTILREHIQSSQPPIRQFPEHTKEVEKIIRKSLSVVTQPKVLSYEQIRNDLKTEYKQTFYLVDPTIDIIRDTFDHCDITQMTDKTNLDILDANISQTAQLYNQINNQTNLLTNEEMNLLKSNQLTWVNQHLIDQELNEKKITRKQNKELNKILMRAFDLISLNLIYTWDELNSQLRREFPKAHNLCDRAVELIKQAQKDGLLLLQQSPNAVQQDVTSINIINTNGKRRASSLITDRARQNLKSNRKKIVSTITSLLLEYNTPLYKENQIETYVNKTFHYLEGQKTGQFKDYNDVKERLKKDFKHNHEKLIEQIVDVIEQAHATNQFDDIDKPEVQTLMRDRLDGKPLVIKEMYVSLPPRTGAFATSKHANDESAHYLSTSINGDRTLNSSTSSHRVGRGLSWREANERARILFYRGKHPAIHYDEQAAGFDVRMLLETAAGGTQEIPVTDSDVHELLNSCGVQWDGVNIISLVDHSEDVVRAAEQAALKVIREKGLVELRTPPAARDTDDNDEPLSS